MTANSPSSPFAWLLRGTALATAPLLLTACGQGAQQAAPTEEPTGQASETAMAPTADEAAPVVDENAAAPVTDVVPVPVAAQADPVAAAPLADAATITTAISKGSGIERIRHGDGWAWMQNGKIIRTASSDGKRVAYFRNGSDTPFLVQDDEHAYAYSNGKVTHSYDNGHAKTVDSGDRKDAAKLVIRAKDDRNDAVHVAKTNPVRNTTKPSPSPTPSPSPSRSTRESSHRREGTPTPSPTPTASHSTRESSRTTNTGDRNGAPTMRSSRSSDAMRSMRPSPTPTPT